MYSKCIHVQFPVVVKTRAFSAMVGAQLLVVMVRSTRYISCAFNLNMITRAA